MSRNRCVANPADLGGANSLTAWGGANESGPIGGYEYECLFDRGVWGPAMGLLRRGSGFGIFERYGCGGHLCDQGCR